MAPQNKSVPAPRSDARFDYLDRLPANVPPVEHPLSAEHPWTPVVPPRPRITSPSR